MIRSHAIALTLLLAALSRLPVAAEDAMVEPMRGVALLASAVPDDVSDEEVLSFVRECDMELVVFDFAWITGIWPRSDLEAIEALSQKLTEAGVVVAAMYRPRALQERDADVHYAVDATGRPPKDHLDLCLAHEDSVRWGLSWGSRILTACPSIRHLILYNVRPSCCCEACRDGRAEAHVARFIERCREAWSVHRPEVRIGHVGVGLDHEAALDFLCPFLSVRKGADMSERVGQVRALAGETGKPVVPLAKVCWSSATENGTEDVVRAIGACLEQRTGFLLWYYGWIFHDDDDRYDPARVIEALGGDPAKLARFLQRSGGPAPDRMPQVELNGRQWLYFDSQETGSGPRLRVGRVELAASADTVLISYLADRVWGLNERLSVSLGDRNRVLIAFPARELRGARSAELVLAAHKSGIPPLAPFDLAVHRVTEAWSERETSWGNQPAFEEEPLLVVRVDPEQPELRIDLTGWVRSRKVEHGLLLKVPEALPLGAGAAPTGPWTQPPIRTGTPFTDSLPWAANLEDALGRAKAEGKPVLATVVPVGDRQWVSGYAAAREVLKDQKRHPFGDQRGMAIDEGLMKERVMMAALFSDPEIAHLVRSHFVPVRLRLHTFAFDEAGSRGLQDPLPALGTTGPELGGPSLVIATADGQLLHALRRMGVFSAPMVREMLRAVLSRAGVDRIAPFPDERPDRLAEAWALAGEGKFEEADRALQGLRPPEGAAWRWEHLYLRGHLLDARGETDRARDAWRAVSSGDPEGCWGGRAAIRLSPHGPRIAEWECLRELEADSLAESTEVGDPGEVQRVVERAVEHLLLAQRPDGSWRDPFVDPHPGAAPGSQWDKAVPRTGLCVDALLQARARLPRRRVEIDAAIARGVKYVGQFADAPQPHVWKLTFALHLQVAILESELPRAARDAARRRARKLVEALGTCQHSGGWSYMPPPRIHSFNTAPVLLLLTELSRHGVSVPESMTSAAAEFLEGLRLEDPRHFAYATTMKFALRASSCRTALCELALLEHTGGGDPRRLLAGVELFFEHEASVRDAAKVFESHFAPTSMHDAYHYYFGHYYAARSLAHLPRDEAARLARRQMEVILPQREIDGTFVDAQMQGRSYSTAMALLTILEDLRYTR